MARRQPSYRSTTVTRGRTGRRGTLLAAAVTAALAASLCAFVPAAAGVDLSLAGAGPARVGSARADLVASPASGPRQLPVAPSANAVATRAGRELVDSTSADVLSALTSAGLVEDGTPALDPTRLQGPTTGTNTAARRATAAQLEVALKATPLPYPLPVDPAAQLRKQPHGVPRAGYEVCATSATKPADCAAVPLGVPVLLDVAGGPVPDLLVDSLPASGGTALLTLRLGTGDAPAGRPLRARVTGSYGASTFGFDGLDRGDGLPAAALGVFDGGTGELRSQVVTAGAAPSFAVTTSRSDGTAAGATSTRVSPVPARFSTRVATGSGNTRIDAAAETTTSLDAIAVTSSGGADRFSELAATALPKTLSATLARTNTGAAALTYEASGPAADISFTDAAYRANTRQQSLRFGAKTMPTRWTASVTPEAGTTTVGYTANGPTGSLSAAYYDAAATVSGTTAPLTVRTSATTVPTRMTAAVDPDDGRVRIAADRPVGSFALAESFDGGDYAPLTGDHITFVGDGAAFGAGATISGVQSADARFDDHPQLAIVTSPGGQPFTAAGVVDGVRKTRVDVANLPTRLNADLDNPRQTITYQASQPVTRIRLAYVDTQTGPSIVSAIDYLPARFVASYDIGSAPRLRYVASSTVPRAEFFADPDGVESVDPDTGTYLSSVLTGIVGSADVRVDFTNGRVEGGGSRTPGGPGGPGGLGGLALLAHAPVAGRVWSAYAVATAIPGRIVTDFGDGDFSLQGAGGAVGSAEVAVTNHADGTVPDATDYLAVHHDERSGDLDVGASGHGVTELGYSDSTTGDPSFVLATAPGTVAVDADALLAPDSESFVGGTVAAPGAFGIATAGGHVRYTADRNLAVRLTTAAGSTGALGELFLPLREDGVTAQRTGDGGAGANIALPDAPTRIDVDADTGDVTAG